MAQGMAHVEVLVALTSSGGSDVDPRLAQMAKDFKKKHLAFTHFEVLTQKGLDLEEGKPARIELFDGRVFEVTLVKQEPSGKLHMRLKLPGIVGTAVYEVSPKGEMILDIGVHKDGELWFIVRH